MRGLRGVRGRPGQHGAATVEYAVVAALMGAAALAASAGLATQSQVVLDRDAGCMAVRPTPAWCHPATDQP